MECEWSECDIPLVGEDIRNSPVINKKWEDGNVWSIYRKIFASLHPYCTLNRRNKL